MSKKQKILTAALLSVLSVLVILNSIALVILWKHIDEQPELIFQGSDTLYKIDDVMYIQSDVVRLDPAKMESGEIKTYKRSEITALENEAIEKRDANKADSAAE